MPNIMIHDIMNQFQIDTALFGQFSGIYYIGYCLMHIPIGIFLDRFGPKKVMSLSIFLTTLGLLPIIFATHWIYPILGRFLIGIGSSGAILGAFKIIRMTFPESQFTRMLSFTVTIGLIGGLYGGVPVGYFSKILGYQKVVEFLIVIGIVFAILTYIFVPQTEEKHSSSILSDIKTVFCNKKAILICFFAGLMVGPMEGFADAWGSEFFKRVYLFNDESANSLTSMIYMGMLFAPVLSKIAEKTKRIY
jgi:predicted MFS family arabinose efflux permease